MRKITTLALLTLLACSVSAAPVVVADFDDVPIGTQWVMWGVYGGPGSSTATVEADPENAQNHVLHIRLNDWNTFPEFELPDAYMGTNLTARFKSVRFRFWRSASERDAYKQFHLYYGEDQLYADQDYVYQGNAAQWQQRSYDLAGIPSGSTATRLRMGIHHAASDYYLDDVQLVGALDDYEVIEGGELNLCRKNSSSDYVTYTSPIMIPGGMSLNVYTSRYTDFNAPVAGEGTLKFYAGGERTFIGEHSGKKYPDWSHYSGDAHIYPYKEVETGAGFYGVVMCHNGKTFSPENVESCLAEGKVCTTFAHSSLVIHDGAALAFENGTRAARFAHLSTEPESRIYGYYKATAGAGSYLLVGCSNRTSTLSGQIAPIEKDGKPMASVLVGLIKEGRGTYRLTNNQNCLSGAIRVLEGRVDICNDAAEAEARHLSGGTGTPSGNAAVAYVMRGGWLGGTGSIAGNVDVYGTVEPGDAGVGVLRLHDYVTASNHPSLRLHPEGRLRFKVRSAAAYDQLQVSGPVEFSHQTQDFGTSDAAPVIRVALTDDYCLEVGDELTLLTAERRADAAQWQWDVRMPSHLTWSIDERETADGRYALVATVTSMDDDPANAGNDADDETYQPGEVADDDDSTYGDTGDVHPLRYYADLSGFSIGVATPGGIAFENEADTRTSLVADHFNMLVPENELKFDAVEPQQGVFSYGNAERMVSFAERHSMYMRGHTLAWHQQVAQWVSSDGKKNDKGWTKDQLMSILRNHIENVVGHFRGRIAEWDVVNECLDDDQSIVRNDPDGYKLRPQSIWNSVCGEAYIDSAFVWAHRADPDARLVLNDYGNEEMGKAKTQAFYNLVRRLVESGVPIHGVGLQCHLDAGAVDAAAIESNIARYADLGLAVTLTELDLGIGSRSEDDLQQQARDYHHLIGVASRQPHCRSVLVWGLTDDMSWRSSNPLLWDRNAQPKPAFYAVQDALRMASTEGIEPVGSEDEADAGVVARYDLQGRKLGQRQYGFAIEVRRDGSIRKTIVLE